MRLVSVVHSHSLQTESALQQRLGTVAGGFVGAIFADEIAQLIREQRADATSAARGDSSRLLEQRGLDCDGDILFRSHVQGRVCPHVNT
jgi:hypothetical protein